MRTRNARVVFVGLAAAAAVVVGSIALRDGPLGGGGASASHDSTLTAAGAGPSTAPAPSIRPLGSMSERLARLPPVAPGELDGILDLGGDDCLLQTIALATLVRTGTPPGLCAAPGGRFAVRLNDLVPRQLDVVDMSGRAAETIAVPDGWDWAGITRQGVVLCQHDDSQLVELDAVTLRPVARLDLAPAVQVFDWHS
jgi:hypothetical protein